MSNVFVEDLDFVTLSICDPVGRVFRHQGQLYRGIRDNVAEATRQLFACGCLQDLIRKGMFPDSHISMDAHSDFAFLVEHETIPYVTYPFEWSFDMFRDAALMILDLSADIANFGYCLKDCHPYNVVFRGARPVFVDLGSFIPLSSQSRFPCFEEFLSSWYRPLAIWSTGDASLARQVISSYSGTMSALSWDLHNHGFLRCLSPRLKSRSLALLSRARAFGGRVQRISEKLNRFASPLLSRLPAECMCENISLLRSKVARLTPPEPTGQWWNYHDQCRSDAELAPRFKRILTIVRNLGCSSLIEVGGNQGAFADMLLADGHIDRVVSTDADVDAVNILYNRCKDRPINLNTQFIQSAVIKLIHPETHFSTELPTIRLRCDIVLALALTHHLMLTQQVPVDEVLRAIAEYTNTFALVEFMPLGLWDGTHGETVPSWYNVDAFATAFAVEFDLIQMEQLEENRILFVGRKRAA